MNLILFDNRTIHGDLLPLTFTRPVADIRFGILTIREKWEHHLETDSSTFTEEYLSEKFPCRVSTDDDKLSINGSVSPEEALEDFMNEW